MLVIVGFFIGIFMMGFMIGYDEGRTWDNTKEGDTNE